MLTTYLYTYFSYTSNTQNVILVATPKPSYSNSYSYSHSYSYILNEPPLPYLFLLKNLLFILQHLEQSGVVNFKVFDVLPSEVFLLDTYVRTRFPRSTCAVVCTLNLSPRSAPGHCALVGRLLG
jgi:hypothetical protein